MERDQSRTKALRKLIFLVGFTGIMLIMTTYAWFSTQRNVSISNLEGTVNVAEGLEISLDALNWSQGIDFSEYTDQNDLKKLYGETEHNIIPTEMLPVSTTGKSGAGDTIGGNELIMYRGENTDSIKLSNIQVTSKTVEDPLDNQYPGYYAIDFFLRNNSREEGEDVLQLNTDSSVMLKAGGVYTTGLQNTVRVAFTLYNSTTPISASVSDQSTILGAMTGDTATIKDVSIWEPNAKDHIDYIVINNNKITWKAEDKLGYIADQTNGKYTAEERIPTYALMSTAVGQEYTDIYKWDGSVTGLEKQITLQTDKTAGTYKIAGGIHNLISVSSSETALYENNPSGEVTTFKIPKNQICRIRMYVWLEGQDVDCTNYASHGGGIIVDVGLTKGETEGTGSDEAQWVKPSEIFDADGTNADGLHIGDFVNYDAGTWTASEISAIQTGLKTDLQTANGSTDLPSGNFQFGGFTAGSSRNGNATPDIYTDTSNNLTYGNYVQDASTNSAVTGWRVFDIDGDNVTLISAGNPEDYYHPYGTNYGYASEYILTGNVNSGWSTGETDKANYQKRDWGVYVNGAQKATSAIPLTKARLDNWYTKYTSTANADTWDDSTFQKIYQEPYTKYQNMVENYSYYWLSAAYYSNLVYYVDPNFRYVSNISNYAFGVRVLVSLSSDVLFTAENIGTKTITGGNMDTYGGEQTYNYWGIQ